MVLISYPPPQRPISPEITILAPNTRLIRIYDPTQYNTQDITFRYYGPLNRFDHHQHPLASPAIDGERGINYWGLNLSCCLVEVFGDTGIIEIDRQLVAIVELTQSLKLLELRGSGAMKLGTVAAISSVADRELSQAWSRFFYENVNLIGEIDGIIFSNAHNQDTAIALYERAESKLQSAFLRSIPLASNSLQHLISECAIAHSLIFL
jgi:RES domain